MPAVNQGFGGVLLKPWNERKRSATEMQQVLQEKWNHIAGARVAAFQFPPLPGSQGLPLQFVITTTEPIENLYEVAQPGARQGQGQRHVLLRRLRPEARQAAGDLEVDRDMVADAGPDPAGCRLRRWVRRWAAATSTTSRSPGRSYKVIPQVLQEGPPESRPGAGLLHHARPTAR